MKIILYRYEENESAPNLRRLLLILIFIFMSGSVHSQKTIITNQEFISRMAASPAFQFLEDSVTASESILILNHPDNALSDWMAQILTDSCLQRNYLVYSTPDSSTAVDYTIVLSNPQVEVIYRSAGKRLLFFSKGIQRTIEVFYHLQIKNKNGRILVSRQIQNREQDVVPAASIERIENDRLSFTKGTKPASSLIKRWMEPVLITAATMTVIYLFYTLRSEK